MQCLRGLARFRVKKCDAAPGVRMAAGRVAAARHRHRMSSRAAWPLGPFLLVY